MNTLTQSKSACQQLSFDFVKSWNIQGRAAKALETGCFNFQVAVEQFITMAQTNSGDSIIVISYTSEQAEALFDLLLDLFLDNRLSYTSTQLFLIALQVGVDQVETSKIY